MNEQIVVEMMRVLNDVNDKLDAGATALENHMRIEEGDMRGLHDRIAALHTAFPNGDLQGHQMYHASLIERNTWITKICKESVEKMAQYGLIGFVIWLGYQAWTGFLAGPK